MKKLFFPGLLLLMILMTCEQNEPSFVTFSTTSLPAEGGSISPAEGEFEEGNSVEVSAEASEGWNFIRWEGDKDGAENPDTVMMSRDKNIAAVFGRSDPDDGEQNPDDGEQNPDDGEQDPDGGEQDPDDGEQDPGGGEQDPDDGEQDPGGGEQDPDDGEQDPGGGDPDTSASGGHLVVMPLGDSITNDGRSRIRLWNLLTDDGYTLDYVGDQQQNNGVIPDPDHEGVGGITIQGIHEKAESLMIRHDPEYIFLMVGTNNIAWYINEPAEAIAERWNELVQDLLDHSGPEAWLIAATIPPVTSKEAGHESLEETDRAVVTAQYNEILRDYISQRQSAGDRIILADTEAVMTVEEHLYEDGVHLNAEGYELMGTVYYEAIRSILAND
ncbi:MAG: GDSL-type esterase/lipase family protein [Balneolaceae bacterium]